VDEVRAAFTALARHNRILNRIGLDRISCSYLKVIRNFADTTL
jgi:hypothetical protein